MRNHDHDNEIRISERRRVSVPLAILISLLVAAASIGGTCYSFHDTITEHTNEIADLKNGQADLQKQQTEQREILIRIDENVKLLREEHDNRNFSSQ